MASPSRSPSPRRRRTPSLSPPRRYRSPRPHPRYSRRRSYSPDTPRYRRRRSRRRRSPSTSSYSSRSSYHSTPSPRRRPRTPSTPSEDSRDDRDRDSRTVFVHQLAQRAGERDLYQFFNRVGDVRDVRLIMDRYSKHHKSAGYVEFYHVRYVQRALRLSGETLCGVPIVVKPCVEQGYNDPQPVAVGWSKRRPKPNPPPPHPPHTLVSIDQLKRLLNPNNIPIQTLSPVNPARADPNSRLYVGSLPFHFVETDLRNIFEPFGNIASVAIQRDAAGKSKGFAFVQFQTQQSASNALKINGLSVDSRSIKVALASHESNGPAPTSVPHVPLPLVNGTSQLDEGKDGGMSMNASQRVMLMQTLSRGETLGARLEGDVNRLQVVKEATMSLILCNLFDPKTEAPGFERELAEDVRDECMAKYGTVVHLQVETKSHGVVYIRFKDVIASAKAQRELNGRWFGGKRIQASFVSDKAYLERFPKVAH